LLKNLECKKHNAQDFVVHKEGCSPTTKGLTTILKPISEYSSPLWKVLGESNARHKPDLNADVDSVLSVGIIFEESERGGTFKEWIRHSLGWSSSFIVEREAHIVSFIPQNHSTKNQRQNPFVGEPIPTKGNTTSVQFLRFRVTATRNGRAPHLSQLHFYYNDGRILPKSALSNFPTKAPSHYNYAANLLKEDDLKRWYSGEKNSGGLEDIQDVDFQKINITVEFTLPGIYHVNQLAYQLKTASDFPERDPTSWEWYGSADGNSWYLLSQVNSSEVPTSRLTNYPQTPLITQ